jgi:hypothetical protein
MRKVAIRKAAEVVLIHNKCKWDHSLIKIVTE